MQTRNGNLHLEIQTSRKNPVGILRTSFRDKSTGKISHSQHGRISGCSLEQLRLLQAAFREQVQPVDGPHAFRILGSKEYGASRVLLQLAKDLGLHRILYSRTEPWVDCVLAMIAELQHLYGLEKVVFVGDRGMVTQTRLSELRDIEGLNTISALTHGQMHNLIEREVIQADLFDEKCVIEVSDPENARERYCLCRNPVTREREGKTRQRLLELTEGGLGEIANYKGLGHVERTFRSLKQVHLEMRPCYHKIDRRIKAHVFLCTLAYYVQWHLMERLEPLFAADADGKDRRWTVQNVIERLKHVTRNEVESNGVRFHQTTECDVEQKQILDLLRVAL